MSNPIVQMKAKSAMPAIPGRVEPHGALLTLPPDGQLLYKIMKVEHFLRSLDEGYLHFQRVDSYCDFPGADAHDAEQLKADRETNQRAKFEKDPTFSAETYFDRARSRTYACCFSVEDSDYIWQNYANESKHGKIGIVFDFARLRETLNQTLAADGVKLSFGSKDGTQIFDLNYGVVQYVEWDRHKFATEYLANPIQYAYIKDVRFEQESELRITLSALGISQFAWGGQAFDFPPSVQFQFDYCQAIGHGTIAELRTLPDSDHTFLTNELAARNIYRA
jgi:hypothetical protein